MANGTMNSNPSRAPLTALQNGRNHMITAWLAGIGAAILMKLPAPFAPESEVAAMGIAGVSVAFVLGALGNILRNTIGEARWTQWFGALLIAAFIFGNNGTAHAAPISPPPVTPVTGEFSPVFVVNMSSNVNSLCLIVAGEANALKCVIPGDADVFAATCAAGPPSSQTCTCDGTPRPGNQAFALNEVVCFSATITLTVGSFPVHAYAENVIGRSPLSDDWLAFEFELPLAPLIFP